MADDNSVRYFQNPAFSLIFSQHESRKFKSNLVQQRIHIQEVLMHSLFPCGNDFPNDNYGDQLLYIIREPNIVPYGLCDHTYYFIADSPSNRCCAFLGRKEGVRKNYYRKPYRGGGDARSC